MSLYDEIHSQPDVLQHSYNQNLTAVFDIAKALKKRDVHYAFMAARGTSDNAARYANYLFGAVNQMPVALATPSLFSLYKQPPRLDGAVVIGISQSGQSPDIVNVLLEGKRQGRPTIAITNQAGSPLALAADYVIDIGAGRETAVSATKTYSTQLLAIAMLSLAMANDEARLAQLQQLPDWVRQLLAQDEQIAHLAPRYRYMQHCFMLGRGYNYATAFEWALKLKELTYVMAEPYSSADFRHGPIAVVTEGLPIMAVAPSGVVFADMLDLLERLKNEHNAELVLISDRPEALALATSPILLPAGIPEWLTPLATIVPAQLFCYWLTAVMGYDTESPRGLNKVTKTT